MAGLYPSKLKAWEQKQVGYHETGKNINKYAADMDKNYPDFFCTKKQGLAWCGVMQCDGFCETYGEKNALKMLYMPKKNLAAVVKYLVGYFKKADAFYDDPEDGDLICFKAKKYVKKDNPEGWYHVGYVESYDKKYVYTIEGNSGDAVKRHKYSLTNAKIGGYCRPDYDKEPSPEPTPTPPQPTPTPTPTPDPQKKKVVKASQSAKSFDKYYAREYTVSTKTDPLSLRDGAGVKYKKLTEIPKGKKVRCYGYYTEDWLYVRYEINTIIYEGFCNKKYLK